MFSTSSKLSVKPVGRRLWGLIVLPVSLAVVFGSLCCGSSASGSPSSSSSQLILYFCLAAAAFLTMGGVAVEEVVIGELCVEGESGEKVELFCAAEGSA